MNNKQFRVMAPARAYGILAGVCALLLAIGLILPLALASSAPADAGGNHADSGPIDVQSGGGDTQPSSTTTSSADQISDVAQGVTDTTIKVGVVLMDLSSVASLGLGLPNYEVEIQQAAYQSLIDQVNAKGGINGRTIEPVFVSRDPIATDGPHSDKAICLKLAKDDQVFAVLGMTYDAGTCAALQYGLPVVTKNAALQQVYDDSHGLLVTFDPSLEHDAVNWANVLVKSGVIDDHKVGMLTVSDKSTYQLPGEAASQQLESLGHPLVESASLDPSAGAAAIPSLVNKLKSAGADQVMLMCDYLTALQFIAIAETQHYYPQYLTSDADSLASNGLLANAGKSLDGAIGFSDSASSGDGAETPQQQECRENYNETTDTKDIPAGVESPLGIMCSVIDTFVDAATKAGSDLNPRSFIQAIEGLGRVDDDVSAVLPGTFAPGKTDYSDTLAPERWSSATKSYVTDGDPISVN